MSELQLLIGSIVALIVVIAICIKSFNKSKRDFIATYGKQTDPDQSANNAAMYQRGYDAALKGHQPMRAGTEAYMDGYSDGCKAAKVNQ